MTRYRLKLLGDHYGQNCQDGYTVIGLFDSRKSIGSYKQGFSFNRSGVVADAKELAKAQGLRSPWKVEEYEA
jgi:hypothetical protein